MAISTTFPKAEKGAFAHPETNKNFLRG